MTYPLELFIRRRVKQFRRIEKRKKVSPFVLDQVQLRRHVESQGIVVRQLLDLLQFDPPAVE